MAHAYPAHRARLCRAARAGAATARGQNASIDPHWVAYLGCWTGRRIESNLCIVPAAGTSTVEFVTVFKGRSPHATGIAATGAHIETTSGDCTGWRSAEWSAHGQRLFLRSEDGCPGARARSGTGVIAMSTTGNGSTSRVLRGGADRPAGATVPAGRRRRFSAPRHFRHDRRAAAAAAPLGIETWSKRRGRCSRRAQAWLVERAEPFTLDAKRLIALADAGVPSALSTSWSRCPIPRHRDQPGCAPG